MPITHAPATVAKLCHKRVSRAVRIPGFVDRCINSIPSLKPYERCCGKKRVNTSGVVHGTILADE